MMDVINGFLTGVAAVVGTIGVLAILGFIVCTFVAVREIFGKDEDEE